jgi:hypothetical protein
MFRRYPRIIQRLHTAQRHQRSNIKPRASVHLTYWLTDLLSDLFTDLLTYWITYLITPWCRALLEQLTGLQLVKKFPAFHGTRRFITALKSLRHLSLSWAIPIQSIYPHPTSWRSFLILSIHLRLGLPDGLFPSGFPTKTLYTPPLLTHTRYMPSPVHLILVIYSICLFTLLLYPTLFLILSLLSSDPHRFCFVISNGLTVKFDLNYHNSEYNNKLTSSMNLLYYRNHIYTILHTVYIYIYIYIYIWIDICVRIISTRIIW